MKFSNIAFLNKAIQASLSAGKAIMDVYEIDFSVSLKTDKSPITEADRQAHHIISGALKETLIPLLSEEGREIPYDERKNWEYYWLVDPLDGTKEFVSRNGEFTVNIALIKNGIPILGVVYAPVPDVLYFASDEIGAYKIEAFSSCKIDASWDDILMKSVKLPIKKDRNNFTIIASRSHMNEETLDYISKLKELHRNTEIISAGSSLKLCLIAENKADVYPRFGTTMEWDIAAGHAIVKYSGGKVMQAGTTDELKYNKPDLRNPFFVVSR